MSNGITDFQKLVSRLENMGFDSYKKAVDPMDLETKKKILGSLVKTKNFYEKNLTIYPKRSDDGQPHYIYTMSEKKLKGILKKGKYLATEIQKK